MKPSLADQAGDGQIRFHHAAHDLLVGEQEIIEPMSKRVGLPVAPSQDIE